MTNPTHRVSPGRPIRPAGRREKHGRASAPTHAEFPFLLPPVEPDEIGRLGMEEPLPVDQLNPKIPRPLSALVMKMLEKNPEDRPPSAKAVLARLRKIEPSRHTGAVQGPSAKRRGTRSGGRRKHPAPRRWLHRCLALVLGLTVGITAAYLVCAGLRADDFIPAPPAGAGGR
jgi:hypothetical protein